MCDAPETVGRPGWSGWPVLPQRAELRPVGDWVDLTYPLGAQTPRLRTFPPPIVSRISEMPAAPLNVTRLEMVVHTGTHVDSPRHFVLDGPPVDAIPLERLTGRGVVVRVDAPPYGVIEPDDLERARPQIEPGDIVAIDSGWGERWGTDDWDRHPALSLRTAEWLVDRGVKLVALDTPTPDQALDRRSPAFDWPIHRLLLSQGVLISEQVANLSRLAATRIELVFSPVPIAGADGAPARVIARPIAA